MARKKVYVSSTFKDLEEHRSAVKATLERAGFDVECMEKYPAFDERPKDKCLADVAECDYYVLILAWRYGFQPEDDNPRRLSIAHLEYEEAVGLKKPCLAFLARSRTRLAAGSRRSQCPVLPLEDRQVPPDRRNRPRPAFVHHARQPRRRRARTLARRRAEAPERRREGQGANPRELPSVELLGLDLKDSQNVRLGQVYVPAVAMGKAGSGERESLREERHTLLLHRLGEGSLYVPGAPGSGKPTFCRWLALLAAGGTLPDHPIPAPERFRETLPDALRARFPLLCRLREWAGREEGLSGKGHWTRAQLGRASPAGWTTPVRAG